LDTAFIQEEEEEDQEEEDQEEEEEEKVPDWEEPNEDEPYEFGFTHYVADAFESAGAFEPSAFEPSAFEPSSAFELSAFELSAFESSTYDSQILELLSDDEDYNFAFEPSLDVSHSLDVPNCDYTIYTNWRHADNSLNPIMASRIFPKITLLDVIDKQWAPMPIPNLLIGVNSMYETSSSQKWMDWL
jgi:hypothetical protein